MKKSIILGFALLTFSSAVFGSTINHNQTHFSVTTLSNATPLCLAISKGDIEAVKKFVQYGADVNEKSNGMTPLMIAARYNNVEIIELLIAKGADLSVKNERGFTALKIAELSNAHDAIAILSQKQTK